MSLPRDGGLPMPLTPHELVQVAWEFCCMATFHALKFALRSGPVTLNMLSVGTCCRVYKVSELFTAEWLATEGRDAVLL